MKVLFIHSNSSLNNGASISLLALVKIIKGRSIEVIVVVPAKGPLLEELEKESIKTYVIRDFNDWYYTLNSGLTLRTKVTCFIKSIINIVPLLKLIDVINKEKIDLIHINTVTIQIAAKAALLTSRKLIWHIREYLEEDLGITYINKKQSIKLFNKADYMIAISKGIYDKYSKVVNNIELIHNGIDTDFFNPDRNIFTKKNISITLAGRFVPEKGQMELIQAINILVNKGYDNIRVTMIGNNNNDSYYYSLIKTIEGYNLEKYIKIYDYSKNMHDIWLSTDIACICSVSEAFGRVTVEAMLEGILVIGANTGGTAEIIDDNTTGFLYSQGNYYNLAEKIELSINDCINSKKIALNGQKEALKKYTSVENANNVIKIYEECLHSKPE